jgi:hypothetical protein
MPTVKNMSYGSLAIQLSENKQLTLGPRESKEIALEEFDAEGVRKSLRDAQITVLPGEPQAEKKSKPKPIST